MKKKIVIEILSVLISIGIAIIPAPEGLEQNAMLVLASLAWTIINWVSNVIPDFVASFVMCISWVLMGIMPFNTAFSSFSNSTIWLLIGALGIGAAVAKSGLLARISILIMKVFPPTYRGQVMALVGSGVILGPFIPAVVAKTTIVGTMSTSIGEMLGFKPKSKGMSGLWAAMYTGYALLAPLVLSSCYYGYIVVGLLPENVRAEFTWGRWLQCALPWGIICIVGSMILINLMYKPEEYKKLDKRDIQEMLKEKGPLTRNEKIVIVILFTCILLWVLEKVINVQSAITALLGLAALLALGVLTPEDYNTRINWGMIAFIGGALNLAVAIPEVGLDVWIGDTIGPSIASLIKTPYIFIPVLAVIVLLVRFVIVDMTTCYTLFIIILTPVCVTEGMNPWVMAFTTYSVIFSYFTKYQSVSFISAYGSAGGDEKIGYKNIYPYCCAYYAVAILALVACVPYWKFLGLLP